MGENAPKSEGERAREWVGWCSLFQAFEGQRAASSESRQQRVENKEQRQRRDGAFGASEQALAPPFPNPFAFTLGLV